jgi:hypothetical protein
MPGTPVFGTSDPLTLGADWEVQSVSLGGAGNFSRATAIGANGDAVAHNIYDGVSSSVGRISGTITAVYVGAETDYPTALDGFEPGTYHGSLMITGVTIDYGPCASGQRETVQFAVTNTALTADSSIFKPSLSTELATKQEGTGIPSLLTAAGADSEATACTYALTCEIGTVQGADGNDIAAAATFNGQEVISQSYVGDPGAVTAPTGFLVVVKAATAAADKTNTGYDTYNATANANVLRYVAP